MGLLPFRFTKSRGKNIWYERLSLDTSFALLLTNEKYCKLQEQHWKIMVPHSLNSVGYSVQVSSLYSLVGERSL
jgi:hypothetical protein